MSIVGGATEDPECCIGPVGCVDAELLFEMTLIFGPFPAALHPLSFPDLLEEESVLPIGL